MALLGGACIALLITACSCARCCSESDPTDPLKASEHDLATCVSARPHCSSTSSLSAVDDPAHKVKSVLNEKNEILNKKNEILSQVTVID